MVFVGLQRGTRAARYVPALRVRLSAAARSDTDEIGESVASLENFRGLGRGLQHNLVAQLLEFSDQASGGLLGVDALMIVHP